MVKGENTLEAGTPASFDDPSRIWPAASRAGPFVAGSTSSDLIGRKRTEAVQGAGLTSALRSFAISLPSRNLTLKMTPSGIRQV